MSSNKKNKGVLLMVFLLSSHLVCSQSVFGKWRTVDDQTGVDKGIVEIYEKNGFLQAKILKTLEKGRENAVCIKCKGELKDQPVVGMHVMRNFKPNAKGEYKGNNLLDPESGTVYRGKVWLDVSDKNKLKVRGYLAFFYRTQTWYRITED